MKWRKVKLIDISNPKQWKNLPVSELTESGYSVYGANGIIGKYKEYNHELPTLAITCRGATCGTVNITEPKSYITSNAMAIDNLDPSIYQKFLYYALIQRGFKDVITGSAQPQITKEGLSKITLSIPEKYEDQVKIATILSKVESLIKQRNEGIALSDEFLKSIFIKRFIDIEYPLVKLESITTKITDGEHKKPEYKEYGKPFISVVNISKGFLNFENCKFVSEEDHLKFNKRCNPEFEDIIYTKVGATYGRAVVVDVSTPFSLYVSVALIKPDKKKINPYFLKSAINHPFVKRQADKSIKGAGVPDLHLIEIKSFKIPIPPMELQIKFADLVQKTEAIKTQCQQSLKELENLFASLSQMAFKGELDLSRMEFFYEEQHSSADNDRTEPKPKAAAKKTIPKKPILKKSNQSKSHGEAMVVGERLANQIKGKYQNKHFSFEMLLNFLKREKSGFHIKYFSSEEIKANPKYDEGEDLKVFLESAIVNLEMDVKQKERRNPWLNLKQHFYNAKKENINLELTKEDFELIKNRTAEERSGIYFNIVSDEIS